MKMKKLTTIAIASAIAIGTFGISVPANATPAYTTDYTLTIPATLSVANAGWNASDGITAVKSGDYDFDADKKLSVTAASENSWALKSGDNSVGYNLATAEADYSATAESASWEFSAEELNAESGTNKSMGINVQDYTEMDIPAGEYKDTVTFTAKVETAATLVTAITLNKTQTAIYYTGIADADSETLSVSSVTPDDADDKTVTWSSDNTSVATVDASTGAVRALAEGTANITATANDGSGVTATCAVTVTDISTYYSKMVECGCGYGDDYYDGSNPENGFNKQVLSSDVAIALAKIKAEETGSNCAVFYDNGGGMAKVMVALNDGTTKSCAYYYTASDKGLDGYKGYYVSK